jgi:hypothetical protein
MKNKTSYFNIVAGTITWGGWGKRLSVGKATKCIVDC